MKLTEIFSSQFKKDLKKIKYNKKLLLELLFIIEKIKNQEKLDEKYLDHKLTWNLKDFRECHIKPDRLLIYKINKNKLILSLARTWNHNNIFENF